MSIPDHESREAKLGMRSYKDRMGWTRALRRVVGLMLAVLLLGTPAAGADRLGSPEGSVVAVATDPEESVLQTPFVRREAKRGLDLLYDMRFDEAAAVFARIDARYPEHPIGPFLKALTTWWEILLDLSDTSHDDAFYAAMEEVIERSDRMLRRDDESLDAMFFKGAALGFRGRLRSNRGNWLRAARDGIQAMDYVLGVAEREPENDDYVFGKGIYDYYAAVVPKRYPFVKPVMVFFPDGDRAAGLAELERTAEEGYFIQTEAAYFLLQIYYIFEQDFEKSRYYATWLRQRHPGNAFFHTFEGRVYARWGMWAQSDRIFRNVLDRYQARRPGYTPAMAEQALYYLARGAMAMGECEAALEHLLGLEALAGRTKEDTFFKVLGRLRQGMCHDALGRRAYAVARYKEVLEMEDHAGAHDRARRYLQTPYR